MSLYRYEAIDASGKVVMGAMDAPNEAGVSARLAEMGYRPMTILPAPTNGAKQAPAGSQQASGGRTQVAGPSHSPPVVGGPTSVSGGVSSLVVGGLSSGAGAQSNKTGRQSALNTLHSTLKTSKLGGAHPKDLALFFRQFAALVRSGISLFEALDNLAPRTAQPALNQTAVEMSQTAHAGGRISDVMEKYPRLFAPHVVAGVRSGEQGGFLEIVLDEIALDYEQEVAFYKGMWLPKTLVVQALFALAIAQPLFPTLFPENNLVGYLISVVFRNIPILCGLILLGKLWYNRMQLPENRRKRDELALRVPVFGDLARQKALASFVRSLRRLFAAGIGPIGAWEGAMNVAPNLVIREKLEDAKILMEQNVPLHEAFARTGLFANETESLLATGQMSGQMVEMLDRVAEYYQENVDRAFGNARFWMYRIGITLTLIITGVMLIMMAKTYFGGVFKYVDDMFPELNK